MGGIADPATVAAPNLGSIVDPPAPSALAELQ